MEHWTGNSEWFNKSGKDIKVYGKNKKLVIFVSDVFVALEDSKELMRNYENY